MYVYYSLDNEDQIWWMFTSSSLYSRENCFLCFETVTAILTAIWPLTLTAGKNQITNDSIDLDDQIVKILVTTEFLLVENNLCTFFNNS